MARRDNWPKKYSARPGGLDSRLKFVAEKEGLRIQFEFEQFFGEALASRDEGRTRTEVLDQAAALVRATEHLLGNNKHWLVSPVTAAALRALLDQLIRWIFDGPDQWPSSGPGNLA